MLRRAANRTAPLPGLGARVAGRTGARLMFARAAHLCPARAHGAAQNRRAPVRPATPDSRDAGRGSVVVLVGEENSAVAERLSFSSRRRKRGARRNLACRGSPPEGGGGAAGGGRRF